MRKFIERFVYRSPGVYHNPLMHPFLLVTAAMGVAFVFFPATAPVQASVLYQLTIGHLPDVSASIWGIAAMTLTVVHLIAIQVRVRWLGLAVTYTGFLLWLYAAILYALFGFWLQVFITAIPNMVFWAWYHIFVRAYHDERERIYDD